MINWISTKEVANLPDTNRKVLVIINGSGSDTVHTAFFKPDFGWRLITSSTDQYMSADISTVSHWADYNLPQ